MQDSEKLTGMIYQVSSEKRLSLIDSVTFLSEDLKIDIEDIIPILDSSILEQIKIEAIKNRNVQKSVIGDHKQIFDLF